MRKRRAARAGQYERPAYRELQKRLAADAAAPKLIHLAARKLIHPAEGTYALGADLGKVFESLFGSDSSSITFLRIR